MGSGQTASSSGFSGRRFLVTGGAQGIGAEIVARLSAGGADGVIVDLAAAADDAPWPSRQLDVTDEPAVVEAMRSTQAEHGPFDGVIAAAGIVPPWHRPADVDLDMFDQTMAVNVRGFVVTVKSVAESMPHGSSIVAIGSLNSWRGDPNLLAYAASKHAVLGAVRSMAMSLGPRGIRVNAVAPGPVATDALRGRMSDRAGRGGPALGEALEAAARQTALRRLATPGDVADTALFLSSAQAAAITGQLIPVDGGLL
ncbi:SDR family oxidoreductase [Plantibacter sp. ME-Dv--P-122b]|uniref:SDR family NAD(P)-dependent oxidoreductase n=1 Tax=Plantibacter sp. ME-Dv--P-122b TaxID=3040300 RepID=UPI00254C341A|nr:SDR family oxidoreductase [Plantibacter sp. ME-Dv--P-122b]